MDANLTLSKAALDIINKSRYGIGCGRESEDFVLQSYINKLDCKPKQLICIEDSNCDTVESLHCKFYVNNIDFEERVGSDGRVTSVQFKIGDSSTLEEPLQYTWSFISNNDNFSLIGNLNSSVLNLRANNPYVGGVITVSLKCIDNQGCIAERTCEYESVLEYDPSIVPIYYTHSSGMGCF